MPRQQVYGKRSKVNFEALAIFADRSSSPSPRSEDREAARDVKVLNARRRYEDASRKDQKEEGSCSRRILDEVSGNYEVKQTCHAARGTVRRRPKTREIQVTRQEGCAVSTSEDSQVRKKRSESRQPIKVPKETCAVFPPAQAVLQANELHGNLGEFDTVVAKHSRQNPSPTIPIRSESFEEPTTSKQPRDIYSTHAESLLSLADHKITNFDEWSTELSSHFHLTKIAEASYGEVYRLSLLSSLALPGFSNTDESVLKIIALQAPAAGLPKDKRKLAAALRKQGAMSKVEDVANEVRLLQRMSSIPGFTNFRDVRVVRGRPPPAFIEAFRSFNAAQQAKEKELSVFPDPAKKTSYAEDQLWAVIEMQDAGSDLERCVEAGQVTSIWAIWDVFWQVVLTLGKGEEVAEFEHRDLHLGNICIRSTSTPSSSSSNKTEKSQDPSEDEIDLTKNLNFANIETTIIDYTLSRALMPCSSTQCSPQSRTTDPQSQLDPSQIAFHDLALPCNTALFEADSTDEYQYDIYRYMRDITCPPPSTFSSIPRPHTDSPWSSFHPRTNLIWLHFLLHKLFTQPQLTLPSTIATVKPTSTAAHRMHKRGKMLERALRAVQGLLEPEVVIRGDGFVQGARDLVVLALGEGWLGVADVIGGGEGRKVHQEDRTAEAKGAGDMAVAVQGERKDSAAGLAAALAGLELESVAAGGAGVGQEVETKVKRRRGKRIREAKRKASAA